MNIKKEILVRVRAIFVLITLVCIAITYSIFNLQFNQGDYWTSKSKKNNPKEVNRIGLALKQLGLR